jgi:hypothetical protein
VAGNGPFSAEAIVKLIRSPPDDALIYPPGSTYQSGQCGGRPGADQIRLSLPGINPADTYIRAGTYAFFTRSCPIRPEFDGAGILDAVRLLHTPLLARLTEPADLRPTSTAQHQGNHSDHEAVGSQQHRLLLALIRRNLVPA